MRDGWLDDKPPRPGELNTIEIPPSLSTRCGWPHAYTIMVDKLTRFIRDCFLVYRCKSPAVIVVDAINALHYGTADLPPLAQLHFSPRLPCSIRKPRLRQDRGTSSLLRIGLHQFPDALADSRIKQAMQVHAQLGSAVDVES